jgi:ectoine hydroxylase-related dioxygenase (phytanoyl-CoA dioxygenase family)
MVALIHLANDAPVADVLAALDTDGAVVIDHLLDPHLLSTFRADMERAAGAFDAGTRSADATVRNFWGDETKRFTRLASRSDSFVNILLDPIMLAVADALLLPNCSTYWMNTGQMMIIGPGESEQVLHRDADNWRMMNRPDGFEVTVSCMFAITDFTEAVGATRVVPGSNRWDDYKRRPTAAEITEAVMSAGSGMIYTGRALHGAGANATSNQWRFGLHVSYVLGWLTPEEAAPLGTEWSVAAQLPERAQQLLGWRCYASGGTDSTRLWTVDYEDVPIGLGLLEGDE